MNNPCGHEADSIFLFGEIKNDAVAEYCSECGHIWWIKGEFAEQPRYRLVQQVDEFGNVSSIAHWMVKDDGTAMMWADKGTSPEGQTYAP